MAKWIGPYSHIFRKKKYRIRFVPKMNDAGECDSPDTIDKEIVIALQHNKDPKEELNTLLHEALHACAFDLSEDAVEEISSSISSFLWKLGYRR